MARRAARGDHDGVAQRRAAVQIDGDDVFGLVVVQRGHDALQQIALRRRPCRRARRAFFGFWLGGFSGRSFLAASRRPFWRRFLAGFLAAFGRLFCRLCLGGSSGGLLRSGAISKGQASSMASASHQGPARNRGGAFVIARAVQDHHGGRPLAPAVARHAEAPHQGRIQRRQNAARPLHHRDGNQRARAPASAASGGIVRDCRCPSARRSAPAESAAAAPSPCRSCNACRARCSISLTMDARMAPPAARALARRVAQRRHAGAGLQRILRRHQPPDIIELRAASARSR